MKPYSPILFVELNNSELMFVIGKNEKENYFKILYKDAISIQSIYNSKIIDQSLILDLLKKNILIIEQKINYNFKEAILIINNFGSSLINFTGFKKLNGSQLVKENITYILNSLKSKIIEFEKEKEILHIFNSKYLLDRKKIENLPIGLFGNFYSHELSFLLINKDDYKNFHNIFNKCNLKIKKIISKNFIEGATLINKNSDLDTFFKIEINKNDSQIFFFEDSALKFVQDFKFGSNLVINDISKITGFTNNMVSEILRNLDLSSTYSENDLVEKKYFKENYKKIKKSFIIEIANARIKEFSEIIILKNINLNNFLKKNKLVILMLNDELSYNCLSHSYKSYFSDENNLDLNLLKKDEIEDLYDNAFKIVQYGWKKEAVPFIHEKKSLIARFFDLIFK